MTNLLDLPDYTVLGRRDTDFEIIFTIRYNNFPVYCPRCGVVNPPLTRFGTKKQLFNDLPVHAKRVGLQVIPEIIYSYGVGISWATIDISELKPAKVLGF